MIQYDLSPTPPPILAQSNTVFFVSPGDKAQLERWLKAHAWRAVPPTSPQEYGRYRNGGALIIAYHTGTIVCAGRMPHHAASFLRQAVIEQTTLALHWSEVR